MELLTGILVVITGVYAYLTFKILQTNRDQLAELNRPYVTIRTKTYPNDDIIYLSIENTGKTVANNLTLKLDKDFHPHGRENTNLRDYNIFKRESTTLTPGTDLLYYLGLVHQIFGEGAKPEKMPPIFSITAIYRHGNRRFEEATTIDLHPYLMEVTETDATAKSIKEFSKQLDRLIACINNAANRLKLEE